MVVLLLLMLLLLLLELLLLGICLLRNIVPIPNSIEALLLCVLGCIDSLSGLGTQELTSVLHAPDRTAVRMRIDTVMDIAVMVGEADITYNTGVAIVILWG